MARDLLTIDFDRASGITVVTGIGSWTPAYVDAHFAELRRQIEAQRLLGIAVQVVVDLRDADIQPQGTSERIAANAASSYREGDRVALVVSSSLAKMHMRRCAARRDFELFLSYNAALTWLTAYAPRMPDAAVA
ncbi:hypothetical protein [Sphingomonas immobilis]|uniref:STAS/SEC14 domain-containing protein n=1 Tax=Sphingomonas immobilis TaxID=3063997 RepID=A0ABT8ZUS1_9SPHN|nr:hypothetical protein [Sphingomonas sp. CA1-15]MDO7841319.1 hypothetical protein [Sphingomonas sp. CA1-15]